MREHPAIKSDSIDWVWAGCLIEDHTTSKKFWNGFAKLGCSESGVHYKSMGLDYFCIPWESLIIDERSYNHWLKFGPRVQIKSIMVSEGSLFTNHAVLRSIEKAKAANQRGQAEKFPRCSFVANATSLAKHQFPAYRGRYALGG